MTERPGDDETTPDEATPDAESSFGDPVPEPGLVEESDELDLGDEPADGPEVAEPEEVDAAAADAEPEPDPEPEPQNEPDPEPVAQEWSSSALEGQAADDDTDVHAADDTGVDGTDVDDTDDESDGYEDESLIGDDDLAHQAAMVGAFSSDPLDDDGTGDDGTGDGTGDEPVGTDGDGPKRHWGRRVLLLGVLVIGALYVGGYFLTGSRMPANATVGGVDVGGMSPSEARGAVDEVLTPRVDQEIVLTHEETEFRLKPADAGLTFDLDRSIDEAGGARSWKPQDMVALFFGEHDHDPALDVDESTLQSAIGTIGTTVNVEVVEAQISFPDGEPEAREPEPGLVVAREDAATAIQDAYLVSEEPVEVPTAVVEPAVDAEGLEAAMTEIAEPAVSGPIRITVGETDVDLPVGAYAPALVVRVEDNQLQPYIDPEALAKPLTDSTTGIGKKAVDATVEIEDGKPVVVPGKEGVGLQPEEMSTLLLPALTKTGDERAVEVEATVVEPEFSTEDAEALKIVEKTGEFTTYFPYAEYRNINQGRAAELIDGVIVKPGETFSFNDTVGERTVANGFTTGSVINGGVFRDELGGGVSQVVTTTYNAAFFAGLDDVEHHPHAFYIDRYPVGREATVYFGSLDLRFKNSTDYGVLIKAGVKPSTPGSRGETTVQMWSTKIYDVEAGASERRNFREPGRQYDDTDRCVVQSPIQGFDIDIYRIFKQDGKEVKRETDTARYQAADTVICGKDPADEDDED